MKPIRIAVAALAVGLVSSFALADGWSVSIRAGGDPPVPAAGHGHHGGYGGYGLYGPMGYSPWGPVAPVWAPPPYRIGAEPGWNVGYSRGYAVGGYWDRRWGWGQTVYFIYPWPYYAGTYTFIGNWPFYVAGAAAGEDVAGDPDPAPIPGAPGHGVFMVPVSAPPPAPPAALDGIRAPIPQPSTSADAEDPGNAPDPSRRLLDPAAKLFRSGALDRADAELAKLIRANPSDAEVTCDYAYVLVLRGKYVPAAFLLRRSIALDAKQVPRGSAAIALFHDSKASDAAIAKLGKYLETQPNDASARLLRAWLIYLEARFDEARAEVARVLEISPGDAQAEVLRDVLGPPASTRQGRFPLAPTASAR